MVGPCGIIEREREKKKKNYKVNMNEFVQGANTVDNNGLTNLIKGYK